MTGRERRAPELVIPAERLPPGFAERVDSPPEHPAPAEPAATLVLLRDGVIGLEALLLQRHRASGFVPGAWVFPGGRVDASDADPALLESAHGLPQNVGAGAMTSADPPGAAYWMAAAREVFEETGVLLARDARGVAALAAGQDASSARCREELLADRATLLDVLRALGASLDFRDTVYFAHWITPLAERRRYDTRFFIAAHPPGRTVVPDPREMTDARWLTPPAALALFAEGELPMVFPTVKTLEALAAFETARAALDAFRTRRIAPIMPRLVRAPGGVGIVVDEPNPDRAGDS